MGDAHIGHEWDSTRESTSEEGEKVKSKLKAKSPPPPSDISSSDISDSSNDEEINKLTKNLDGKTKLFMTKLMEDLENVQAVL